MQHFERYLDTKQLNLFKTYSKAMLRSGLNALKMCMDVIIYMQKQGNNALLTAGVE